MSAIGPSGGSYGVASDWLQAEVQGSGERSDAAGSADGLEAIPKGGAWRMYDAASGGIRGTDEEFEQVAAWVGSAVDVAVAVVDSGVDWTHPLFDDNRPTIAPGSPALDEAALSDSQGHGTHVAGIASYGTDKIKIVPQRNGGLGNVEQLRAAVANAKALGARVVNMSFYVRPSDVEALRDLAATNPDILFVQSAGNWNFDAENLDEERRRGKDRFAGHEPNAILVSNATPDGQLSDSSGFGRATVLLAARGTDVISAVPREAEIDGDLAPMTGTSMAAPFVSNVAAKLLSLCPSLTPADVRELLAFSVDRTENLGDKVLTRGMINPERAYRAAALLRRAESGADVEQAVATLPGRPIDHDECARLVDLVEILRPHLTRYSGDEEWARLRAGSGQHA